jgi:hypothetical protein
MAAISNQWGDIRNWIKNVISSMNDRKQYTAVQNLIFLLSDRMKKQGVELGHVHAVQRSLLLDLYSRNEELLVEHIKQQIK